VVQDDSANFTWPPQTVALVLVAIFCGVSKVSLTDKEAARIIR